MTAVLKTTTIKPIYDTSSEEDAHPNMLRRSGKEEDTPSEAARRQSKSWFDSNIGAKKSGGKDKEKSKKHRSTNHKHSTKEKSRHAASRRTHGSDREGHSSSSHHRRRSTSSTSEDEEDDEEPQHDNSMALATRKRLTSPSMVSHFTTRTNATNKSSGSSGSNSTVTQASLTRKSTALVHRPASDHVPMSPAVPDAPDVFAYLEAASVLDVGVASGSESESGSGSDQEEGDDERQDEVRPHWSRTNSQSALVHAPERGHNSSSSSTSSSLHEDDSSSPTADNDTDRSTSPERSVKDHDSDHEETANDAASIKIKTQMAAAQQRQHLHALASPSLQRINTSNPHTPSSMLTPHFPAGTPHPPQSPKENQPLLPGSGQVSGYELLATRLSTRNPDEDGRVIKPIYRKFEKLNHRVLLFLQDELSVLEEHLERIDHADGQARRLEKSMIPASRRAAAQAGGELEWHKADVMGKIGYKLTQYNQALSSFKETQSLSPPEPEDISNYREYLHTEQPIAEEETHFLDPIDDLVSVCSESVHIRPSQSIQNPSYAPSTYSVDERPSIPSTYRSSSSTSLNTNVDQSVLPGLAAAIAASVVIPILTFSVIDKFLGRLVVASLVAVGLIGALLQGGLLARGTLFGQEAIMCTAIYGGVMVIMAGII